ncbi:MAG: alpha/beta hydrolase [Burkholderiales bacterium]|jgi:pimeloyl-ACP methyl ester carboxylesterase|nr:alpha/beta hydrolase [Burkholderiales bacterium]
MPLPEPTDLPTETSASRPIAVRLSDVRGLLKLGSDATVGITDLVEQMHLTIAERALPLGRPRSGRTGGITGAVYRSVRGITRLASWGLDSSLRASEGLLRPGPSSATREAALAVVNGVWGDHLAATANTLAIPMSFRLQGQPVELSAEALSATLPQPRRRIALLIHGLCMNDLQWQRNGHHHGEMLARELGYTSLALHYNSGRHISENGEQLAGMLEQLVACWPVAVDELVIVGHSMGGMVARSACHVAETQDLSWRRHLGRLVCLGTPHHGALLERGGHLVDSLLETSPYVAPFARLGKARSAGITDLRFGNVRHEDWAGRHRHDQRHDDRLPTPLPAGVDVYFVAATTAEQPRGLRHAVIGDGLVTVASAWGEHREKHLVLAVPASHRLLVTKAGHLDLLSRDEVAQALRRWLA